MKGNPHAGHGHHLAVVTRVHLWVFVVTFTAFFVGSQTFQCATPLSSKLNAFCPKSVTYPLQEGFDYEKGETDATAEFKSLVNTLRQHIVLKPPYCIEAIQSYSCYQSYPQCDAASQLELTPCRKVCETTASLCNVTSSLLECENLPSNDCLDAPLVHGLSCEVPRSVDVPFCDVVTYNSSRTFHGPNLAHVDAEARSSYERASTLLPTARCKAILKNRLCQQYFRRCDEDGLDLLPCNTLCKRAYVEGCEGLEKETCTGPQYGEASSCYSLPIPDIDNECHPIANPGALKLCKMVTYPIDSTTNISIVDANAQSDFDSIVANMEHEKGSPVSENCKTQLSLFVCGALFRKCAVNPNDPPLEPCQQLCESVGRECEVKSPLHCSGFPTTNCLDH